MITPRTLIYLYLTTLLVSSSLFASGTPSTLSDSDPWPSCSEMGLDFDTCTSLVFLTEPELNHFSEKQVFYTTVAGLTSLSMPALKTLGAYLLQGSWQNLGSVSVLLAFVSYKIARGLGNDAKTQEAWVLAISSDPLHETRFYEVELQLLEEIQQQGPEHEKKLLATTKNEEQEVHLQLSKLEQDLSALDSQAYSDLHALRDLTIIEEEHIKHMRESMERRQKTYETTQSLEQWKDMVRQDLEETHHMHKIAKRLTPLLKTWDGIKNFFSGLVHFLGPNS